MRDGLFGWGRGKVPPYPPGQHPEFIGADGPFDRFGYLHCAGYRQTDNRLCPVCRPGHAAVSCPSCGGYGEVPLPRGEATSEKRDGEG